jgi:hypothetical protein
MFITILSRIGLIFGVTYKTGSGLDDWIYWHLIHSTRDYRQYSAIAIYSSPLHTISCNGFITVCHFRAHMMSYFHRLIPSLPFLINHPRLPSPELDPIIDNNSLSNDPLCPIVTPPYGSRRKQRLSVVEKACLLIRCLAIDVLLLLALASAGNVFTESLPSSGFVHHNTYKNPLLVSPKQLFAFR